jgi:hypothetical protein
MSGIFSTTFEKSRFDQVLKETFNANKNNGSILLIKINFHGCPIFLHPYNGTISERGAFWCC